MTKQTHIRVGGNWKQLNNVWQRVSGEWKEQVIPHVRVSGSWKECMEYGGGGVSLIKYGKLYVWNDLNFSKEFIEGMHVPSDAEWTILTNAISTTNGVANNLKHPRKDGTPILDAQYNTSTHPRWNAHATHYGRDTVNFSALPGGRRYADGSYGTIGSYGYWWSSSETSSTSALYRSMGSSLGSVHRSSIDKSNGFSVRCVRAATQEEQNLTDGALVKQVQDYNGNWYDCIKIGTQVWTRQSIAATHYTDSTAVTCYDYANNSANTFFANAEESIWGHWVNDVSNLNE